MTEPERQDPTRISRRRLIGGAAAGTAALALPAEADAARKRVRRPSSRRRSADVAIVGAGLAGLTAARELRKAGRSVLVLEARNRVGGRCYSRSIGAGASDVANMGATFVGPTQHRVLNLAKELGIGIYNTYDIGKYTDYTRGAAHSYAGRIPPRNPVALLEAQAAISSLDQMSAQVPLDAPWNAPNAARWDGQTFETWKLQNLHTPDSRQLVDLAIQSVFSAEPRDLSLLFVLFYIHSAGNLEQLINTTGGGQAYRVQGGTQLLSIEMARRLGRNRLIQNAYVRRILHRRGRYELQSDRVTVRAKRVIIAIPPPMAARIGYDPPLPALRDQFTQRAPIGSLIKTIAVYDRPFWRDEGLAGQVTSDTGPVRITFDCSPKSGTPGVLMGFVDGDDARQLAPKSAATRVHDEVESLVRYFGPKARSPKLAFDYVWADDKFARGCPVSGLPPGALLSFGTAIREPVGGIHWAGTETATVWHGYMDGAIQSGERAAREVAASL